MVNGKFKWFGKEFGKREGLNWKFAWRGFLVIWQLSIKRGVESQKHNFFHFSLLSFPSHPILLSLPISPSSTTTTGAHHCRRRTATAWSTHRRDSAVLRWASRPPSLSLPPLFWLNFMWNVGDNLGFWIEWIWVLFRSEKWVDCC